MADDTEFTRLMDAAMWVTNHGIKHTSDRCGESPLGCICGLQVRLDTIRAIWVKYHPPIPAQPSRRDSYRPDWRADG